MQSMKERIAFPHTIFTYILIPVAIAGIVSAVLINLLLTPLLIDHFTEKSSTDLELATSIAMEYCEENFQDLLSLRLSDDEMMVETMYQETLREIIQLHQRWPQVHMLAVSGKGKIEDSTYPLLPAGTDFTPPSISPTKIHSRRIGNNEVLFHSRYFPFWRLHIIALVPLKNVAAPAKMMQRGLFLALAGISAVLLFTLVITLEHGVHRPLNRVIAAAEEIGGGAFPRIESRRKDEIGKLTAAVNAMSTRLQENRSTLEQTLEEKNVLLQEIHHRVKNNLNVVVSLLHLQADQVSNSRNAREILNSSCDRIYSMALVHEKLYQSDSFSRIDLEAYIDSISQQLFSIYAQRKRIERVIRVKNITVDLSLAMPCGLILNELITNSLLHAFPAQESGRIEIKAEKYGTGELELTYSDNGIGIEKELSLSEPRATLGLSLIHILSNQIGAKVELSTKSGYWLRLKIPEHQKRS